MTAKTAAKTKAAEAKAAILAQDTVQVKVREKGDGLISKGTRGDPIHEDETYQEGDLITLPSEIAKALLERDLVDLAE